ncbi:hypothetical protein PbJCM13498_37460 [Prolixibacter bellariivorans]|uniref:Phosphatidylcholine 1-acylhydrolase n=1 Tax=Prolixibacter bellariivorans TaxID=314319 RepID=A0A5M4B4V6_9BACT|nr:hypothetical protein [Prolixibacter bellariivorans]GET34883.1 hypothetical protein PbJCM13498_37460 [Prolixibacter bellariivorans]
MKSLFKGSLTKYGFLGIILLLTTTKLLAQETSESQKLMSEYIGMVHSPSYITFKQGIGNLNPLLFEAVVAPYYLVNLSHNGEWAMDISFKGIIRMRDQRSYPITTPSYMPSLTVYRNFGDRDIYKGELLSFLTLGHHSNGQSGPVYNSDGTYNTEDGNFATNFIKVGWMLIDDQSKGNQLIPEYFKFGFETHLLNSRGLVNDYGLFRLNFDSELKNYLGAVRSLISGNDYREKEPDSYFNKSQLRYHMHFTWMIDNRSPERKYDLSRQFDFSFRVAYHPKLLNDISLFAEYYYGQDYYNIYFNNELSVFRIGLMASNFRVR